MESPTSGHTCRTSGHYWCFLKIGSTRHRQSDRPPPALRWPLAFSWLLPGIWSAPPRPIFPPAKHIPRQDLKHYLSEISLKSSRPGANEWNNFVFQVMLWIYPSLLGTIQLSVVARTTCPTSPGSWVVGTTWRKSGQEMERQLPWSILVSRSVTNC